MSEILSRSRYAVHLVCLFLLSNLVFAALLFVPSPIATEKVPDIPVVHIQPTDLQCLVSAVYHEARGESDKGKRAVLDVIEHRVKKTNKPACQVVAKYKQFPWYKKKGLVQVNSETLSYYNAAIRHRKVLNDEKFIYFNRGPVFGTGCVVIGHHKFCKETH